MAGRLIASGTRTLDATGRAVVTLPTVPAWETWSLSRMTVATRDGTDLDIPSATVYQGTEAGGFILDATYTGNSDTSDFSSPIDLMAGEFLTVVFAGGTLGEIATVQLFGERRRGIS